MLYIYSKDEEVLGHPTVAKDIEDAKRKLIVRQTEKKAYAEDVYEQAVLTKCYEPEQKIKAAQDLIALADGEDVDEATQETADEMAKAITVLEEEIALIKEEVRAEVDAFIEGWVFDIEDITIYEIDSVK